MGHFKGSDRSKFDDSNGRWPSNVIHDGSDEVVGTFPFTESRPEGPNGVVRKTDKYRQVFNSFKRRAVEHEVMYGDAGSAARFFYCAKADSTERGRGNNHPTVKPLALMRYLCLLITPPGGVVLDPFMGSGSTLRAAKDLNLRVIGIESEESYCDIARDRMAMEVLDMEVV